MSHSEMRVSLRAEGLSFISEDFENTEQKTFGFFGASLKSDAKRMDLFIVDLTGMYAYGQSALSYLNIREIYFNYQIDPGSKLYVGRKIDNWSQLDTTWNLGFYNPQFRWNPIVPESQGLTGIFYEKNENSWRLSLFASPVFIPDQGASYELKDGKFENSNPYFQNPPQNIIFQGNIVLPIDYKIEKPETSDVVFQTSYGAQLEVGQRQGFYASLSGIHKPANQLSLGYRVPVKVARAQVEIVPKVYFENNFAGDFGYRGDWGSGLFSVLYSRPRAASYDAKPNELAYNVPEFSDSTSFGPQVNFDLKPFRLGLAYLDTSGGDVREVGPDASEARAALSQRFLFRQAYQAEISYADIFQKTYRLESTFQYRASTKDEFKQIHFRQQFKIKGPWAFWGDVLLIETADETRSNMGPYRNLDQVFIGVTYDI